MKPINVTIGIPAYNEEHGIARVLSSVLKQKQTGWKLTEILVLSDGSSDNTVSSALSVKHSKIQVLEDHKRLGKTKRLGQLFRLAKGELIVMLDADIVIKDQNLITKLVRPFENPKVGLVGGNSRPLTPETFIQKAVYSTFEVFDASRRLHKDGNNVFGATGCCLVIRNIIAKKMKLPAIVNEDVYIYLYCIQHNWNFAYVEAARVWYKLPLNLRDYTKQVLRSEPRSAKFEVEQFFPKIAKAELIRDKSWYRTEVLKSFLRNPVGVAMIIGINVICLPFLTTVMSNYKLSWFTATSTH